MSRRRGKQRLTKRLFKWLVVFVLLGFGLIMLALSLWLGPLVKTGLERFGPEALGAPIRVESASVQPHRGLVSLNKLMVGSPEGYKAPAVLETASMQVNFSLFSLIGDTVVIEDLLLEEPIITYERRKGRSSMEQMQLNAEEAAKRLVSQLGAKAESGGSSRKYVIKRLRIHNGKVRTRVPGLDTFVTLGLPDLEKRDIGGKGGEGSDLGEAAGAILDSLDEGADDILSQAGHSLGETGKGLLKGASEALKGWSEKMGK